MVKTQIQLPDELYRELKAFAAEREWSLAETFRRGAELLLDVHPAGPASKSGVWKLPTSQTAGWRGLSPEQLHDLAFQDQAPPLPGVSA